jgi:putative addiction module component (TIGR02574 family)
MHKNEHFSSCPPESVLRLPREERARIAAKLIASLDGMPEEGVEAAWDAELERRIEQADRGAVQLLDWIEVRDEIARAPKRR